MLKGHPVVVYDSQAREGLKHLSVPPGDGDYAVYFRSWFKVFDDSKTQLDDAVEWLLKSEPAGKAIATYGTPRPELEELVRSDSFRNRVLDMYLFFYRGASGQASRAGA